MRYSIGAMLTTLGAVGLMGCDGTPTAPDGAAGLAVLPEEWAALRVTPEQSQGATIDIDAQTVLFFHFDAKRGLLSAHLPSDPFFCGGGSLLNVGDRTVIETPSEILQRLVRIADSDSRVAIYRANSLNDLFANFCGFLAGPTKVAEGVVRHSQTLSNASFAAHWGGMVTTPTGEMLHLSESYQLTADAHDPNNPATWSLNASSIVLSPAP